MHIISNQTFCNRDLWRLWYLHRNQCPKTLYFLEETFTRMILSLLIYNLIKLKTLVGFLEHWKNLSNLFIFFSYFRCETSESRHSFIYFTTFMCKQQWKHKKVLNHLQKLGNFQNNPSFLNVWIWPHFPHEIICKY